MTEMEVLLLRKVVTGTAAAPTRRTDCCWQTLVVDVAEAIGDEDGRPSSHSSCEEEACVLKDGAESAQWEDELGEEENHREEDVETGEECAVVVPDTGANTIDGRGMEVEGLLAVVGEVAPASHRPPPSSSVRLSEHRRQSRSLH
jgi:hypothetical protein